MRQNKYLNNIARQDHRAIKRITRPMLGFKSFWSARIIIAGIETIHMIRKDSWAAPRTKPCLRHSSSTVWRLDQQADRAILFASAPLSQQNQQIGHWEADTVIGVNHQRAIVALVECKSGYVAIAKVKTWIQQ